MNIRKVRLGRPKPQEPIAKIVGGTHGEVALAGFRRVGPVSTNQIPRLLPKVFTQNLRSIDGPSDLFAARRIG